MQIDPIEAVLPPVLQSAVVWHYTSPASATSIITGRAFWATSITGLNDTSEMLFGMDLLKSVWKDRRKTSDNLHQIDQWISVAELQLHGQRRSDSYVLCASTESDSIQQWDRYGYCVLGVSTTEVMTKQPRLEGDGGRLAPTFTTGWREVIYDEHDQLEHIDRLLDVLEELARVGIGNPGDGIQAAESDGVECVLRSIVYLKPGAFASEAEVRLYGQAIPTGALVQEHMGAFGPSKHILVRARGAIDANDDLPIVCVRIGNIMPSVPSETIALKAILDKLHSPIPITAVETPFRKSRQAR